MKVKKGRHSGRGDQTGLSRPAAAQGSVRHLPFKLPQQSPTIPQCLWPPTSVARATATASTRRPRADPSASPAAADVSVLNATRAGPRELPQLCPVPASTPGPLCGQHRDPPPPPRAVPSPAATCEAPVPACAPALTCLRWGATRTARALGPGDLCSPPQTQGLPRALRSPRRPAMTGGRSPFHPSLLGRKVLGPRKGKQKAKVTWRHAHGTTPHVAAAPPRSPKGDGSHFL